MHTLNIILYLANEIPDNPVSTVKAMINVIAYLGGDAFDTIIYCYIPTKITLRGIGQQWPMGYV